MKRVVVTEKIHPDGVEMLRRRGDVEVVQLSDGDPATLKREIAAAHAVLDRSAVLTDDILGAARQLEVVARHGVGCDNVAVDHLTNRSIPVAIAATANARSVAEHVMMMLTKAPVTYNRATREERLHERGTHRTTELFGKTILIVGYGRIGTLVAPLLTKSLWRRRFGPARLVQRMPMCSRRNRLSLTIRYWTCPIVFTRRIALQ